MADYKTIWKDRKRTLFGLPLSFTKYSLSDERLFIETGIFNRREEEIRLYRILDVTLKRTFGQRLCGVGTIHCCSADKSTPEFDIKSVKKSRDVKNMLSDMIEVQRDAKRVSSREFMIDSEEDECDDINT